MKILLSAAMMLLVLLYPSQTCAAARDALATWGLDVVPSLFPYMLLCQTLSSALSTRNLSPAFLVLPLGLLGGSPSGSAALAACAQKSEVSPRQILTLSAAAGTISPMFFLSTVSAWLGSPIAGRKLLFAHLCGAVIACMLIWCMSKDCNLQQDSTLSVNSSTAQEPISRSVNAVLNVGGCIVLYSVAAGCIRSVFPSLSGSLSAAAHALLEVAGGLHAIAKAQIPEHIRLVLSAAVSGFSGLSILSQNLLFLRPLGVTLAHLILFALLRAAGSAFVMALLL